MIINNKLSRIEDAYEILIDCLFNSPYYCDLDYNTLYIEKACKVFEEYSQPCYIPFNIYGFPIYLCTNED